MPSASSRKTPRSRLAGLRKQNTQYIADALADFQLTIDGMGSQAGSSQSLQVPLGTLQSVVRAGSIFVRKLVLDKSRLLDSKTLQSLNMRLSPLRRVPKSKRHTIETYVLMEGLSMQLTRIADGDGNPVSPPSSAVLSGGPQGYRILVDWPLLGMVSDNNGTWHLSHDQLFNTNSRRKMTCSQWLGQQVVLCDQKGITLEKILRTVANLHGAHSVDGKDPSSDDKEPHVQIVRNLALFGLGYMDLITLETALHLRTLLLDEPSIASPPGRIGDCIPSFTSLPEDMLSKEPRWLTYPGGTILAFDANPGFEQHRIRAPATS